MAGEIPDTEDLGEIFSEREGDKDDKLQPDDQNAPTDDATTDYTMAQPMMTYQKLPFTTPQMIIADEYAPGVEIEDYDDKSLRPVESAKPHDQYNSAEPTVRLNSS